MALPQSTRLISSYKSLATYSSLFVIPVGILVMIGRALDIPFLKSVFPDLSTMKANTAFCFVLSGIALWLVNAEKAEAKKLWAVRGCAAIIFTETPALASSSDMLLVGGGQGWGP